MKNKFLRLLFYTIIIVSFVSCGNNSDVNDDNYDPQKTTDITFNNPEDADLTITSNGKTNNVVAFKATKPWSVSVVPISKDDNDVSWVKVEPMSGSQGDASITISVEANEDTDYRDAAIIISVSEAYKRISINQSGTEITDFEKDSCILGLAGGEIEVPVRSNVNYNVFIPFEYKSWISRIEESKALPSISKEKFNILPAQSPRTGEITVNYRDLVDTFIVIQTTPNVNGKYLMTHPSSMMIKSQGESRKLRVFGNTEYETEIHYGFETPNDEWFSAVFSGNTAIVTIKPNPLEEPRYGYIKFQSKEDPSLYSSLEIEQTFSSAEDIVEIPDTKFKDYLLVVCDKNKDGEISRSEALICEELIMIGMGINDLSGIEAFKYLKELYCQSNNLTQLNVKELSRLETLECDNNQITSLDLNGLNNLESVQCSKNKLTKLDVTGCSNISGLGCSSNLLKELNLQGLSRLTNLTCENNPQLTSINVNGTNLTSISCANNQLASLDFTGLTNIQSIYCDNNKISSLNLSGLTNLEYVYCENNQMTSIDVQGCLKLKRLYAAKNKLTDLNLKNCNNLELMGAYENKLTSFNAEGCMRVTQLDIYDNPDLNSVNVKNCSALTNLNLSNMKLTSLILDGCSSLKSLSCDNNQLTTLNIPVLNDLSSLNCSKNKLQSIDISSVPGVNYLNIDENPLVSINISGSSITNFKWDFGVLESFNASNCSKLKTLQLNNNKITSLNISECSILTEVFCDNNKLSSVDFAGCDNINYIRMTNNLFVSFNTSDLPSLKTLVLSGNKLTSLDVQSNEELIHINCNANELTSIDISNRTKIKVLECTDNKIETLNASGCSEMTKIDCKNNKLKTIDLVGLLKLQEFYAVGNTFENNMYLSVNPQYFSYDSGGRVETSRDNIYIYYYLKPAIYVNSNLYNTIHKIYIDMW